MSNDTPNRFSKYNTRSDLTDDRPSENQLRVKWAEHLRETEMGTAILKMQRKAAKRGMHLTAAEAKQAVLEAIEVDGVASQLPQFAKLQADNVAVFEGRGKGRPEQQSAMYPGRPRRRTVSQFGDPQETASEAAEDDLGDMATHYRETNKRVQSALSRGDTPSTADLQALDTMADALGLTADDGEADDE